MTLVDRARTRIDEIRPGSLLILSIRTFWPGYERLYLELLHREATALNEPAAGVEDAPESLPSPGSGK